MADYSETPYEPEVGIDPYPSTEEGWRALYQFRYDAYLKTPYPAIYQKAEHLFRAFDDAGKEIDQTKRIMSYGAFVINTDAYALGAGRLVLDLESEEEDDDERQAQLDEGMRVWRRSRLKTQSSRWFLHLCALGDWWLVAVRTRATAPYQTRLVAYDPRVVTPTYDATNTDLEQLAIDVEAGGRRYQQIITTTTTTTTIDGGNPVVTTHGLGVVPAAHLRFLPYGDQPGHSVSAAAHLERAASVVDGMLTQAKAIGNRFANPTLITYGYKLGTGSEVQRFGRSIDGAPMDGKTEYLTTGSEAVAGLLSTVQEIDKHIRDTCPEFIFASDSAGESGEARNMRARAFEAKMEDVRGRVYPEIARVTAIAVALEQGRPFVEEDACLVVTGPPILPQSRKGELEALELAKGGMKRSDYTRQLQRLEYVPADADPEEYAAEVADEQAGRAMQFLDGGPKNGPTDGSADDATEPADRPAPTGTGPTDVAVASLALNGAQVSAMLDIVGRVAAGGLTEDAAVALIGVAFPAVSEAAARAVLRCASVLPAQREVA